MTDTGSFFYYNAVQLYTGGYKAQLIINMLNLACGAGI